MLLRHTFAEEVIVCDKGPESQGIFDEQNLGLLRRRRADPESTKQILAEEQRAGATGDNPGRKAVEKGNLVGIPRAN